MSSGQRFVRRVAFAALTSAMLALPAMPASAQDGYLYVTNLDPNGDNWLALRSQPSTRNGKRLAKLGPDTVLAPSGDRSGRWINVLVLTGPFRDQTGWVYDSFVACCRTPY